MSESIVEHTFRHEFGRIVAKLSAKYGTTNLMEIEDAVSDAMLSALKSWGIKGTPENPAGWLFRVADHKLIDKLRRKQKYNQDILHNLENESVYLQTEESELNVIRLMLWCAHPQLDYKDQIAMMLKLVSGFSNKEIAAALLVNVETVKKRIQRAKRKIKNHETTVKLPILNEVPDRFSSLRKAIYLTFNEGYFSISTTETIREDVVFEALRLCKILTDVQHENRSASFALMALMTFHASRLESRLSENQTIVLLENQDRSFWNRELIVIANRYLSKSMDKKLLTEYHIEACIAAVHTNSKSYGETDWQYISVLYKSLSDAMPSPITKLNYAFSLLKAGELDLAFDILNEISIGKIKQQAYLYYATLASYYDEIGNEKARQENIWKAIDTCDHQEIRNVLRKRLNHES